jgi:uncharacterized protein
MFCFRDPWVTRSLPFAFYILVMAASSFLSDQGVDVRWFYALRVGGTAILLFWFWGGYKELAGFRFPELRNGVISVVAGVLVFLLWINLDSAWMVLGTGPGYSPTHRDGSLDWIMVAVRWSGAALVVPLMEELFWRGFVMRWIDRHDFLSLDPEKVSLRALLLSSLLFGLEHTQWLAGLFAGLVYGWLYIRTRNLWVSVLSHGVTNAVLGGWVCLTGNWGYW